MLLTAISMISHSSGYSKSSNPILNINHVQYYANNNFHIYEEGYAKKIIINKKAWEAITIYFDQINVKNHPYLHLKLNADSAYNIRIDLVDENVNRIESKLVNVVKSEEDNHYVFNYDFSNLEANIKYATVYLNPGNNLSTAVQINDIYFSANDKLDSYFDNLKINAFPNPVVEYLKFQIPAPSVTQWAIYDLDGRVMKQAKGDFSRAQWVTVDVSAFKEGMYILCTLDQSGNWHRTKVFKGINF